MQNPRFGNRGQGEHRMHGLAFGERELQKSPAGQESPGSGEPGLQGTERLEFLAEMVKDDVGDQSGNYGDTEIRGGENIVQGEGEGFAGAVGASEFAHQEIGIEEEDDEADFNDRSPERGGFFGAGRHGVTIARAGGRGNRKRKGEEEKTGCRRDAERTEK